MPGENAAPTASTIGFKNVNLNAKQWCAITFYPRSLAEDAAVGIAELVAQSVFYAMAYKADSCAFNGDGSATYFGITGIIPRLIALNTVAPGADGGLVLGSGNAWSELTLAVNDSSKQIPSLVDQLMKTDKGNVAPDLKKLGITDKMDMGQRMEFLAEKLKSADGRTKAKISEALGGGATASLAEDMFKTLGDGAFDPSNLAGSRHVGHTGPRGGGCGLKSVGMATLMLCADHESELLSQNPVSVVALRDVRGVQIVEKFVWGIVGELC